MLLCEMFINWMGSITFYSVLSYIYLRNIFLVDAKWARNNI